MMRKDQRAHPGKQAQVERQAAAASCIADEDIH